MADKSEREDQTGGRQSGGQERPLIHTSEELLQGRDEAWIEHDGQMYRLRITSKGNLILTK